jgi:hypothetical protein
LRLVARRRPSPKPAGHSALLRLTASGVPRFPRRGPAARPRGAPTWLLRSAASAAASRLVAERQQARLGKWCSKGWGPGVKAGVTDQLRRGIESLRFVPSWRDQHACVTSRAGRCWSARLLSPRPTDIPPVSGESARCRRRTIDAVRVNRDLETPVRLALVDDDVLAPHSRLSIGVSSESRHLGPVHRRTFLDVMAESRFAS